MAKITKKEYFATIGKLIYGMEDFEGKSDILNFISKEVELLENKSANRKPTKSQTENAPLIEAIREILLNADVPLSIKDIKAKDERLEELSPQKVSSLLTLIKKEEGLNFVRTEVKKVAYFKLNA